MIMSLLFWLQNGRNKSELWMLKVGVLALVVNSCDYGNRLLRVP